VAYLLLNAVGWPAAPRLAIFALALTVTPFATCVAWPRSLAAFAKTTSKHSSGATYRLSGAWP
jgi:hypothetical protein